MTGHSLAKIHLDLPEIEVVGGGVFWAEDLATIYTVCEIHHSMRMVSTSKT